MKNLVLLSALFLFSCTQVHANANDPKSAYKKYYQRFGQLAKVWDAADYFLRKENVNAFEAMPPNLKIVMPECVSELVAEWESKNSKNIVIGCPEDITGNSWDILVETRKVGTIDWSIKK